MIRVLEKIEISLKTDDFEDNEKMHFQGQDKGIPAGLKIWVDNIFLQKFL